MERIHRRVIQNRRHGQKAQKDKRPPEMENGNYDSIRPTIMIEEIELAKKEINVIKLLKSITLMVNF